MRVPQVEKLLALEVSDIQDSVSVTLHNTFFVDSRISEFVLWGAGSHQGLDLVKIAKTGFEELNVAFEGFECKLLWETILDDVSQGHVNFTSLDSRIGTVKLSVSFLENGRPHLATICSTSREGRHLVLVHVKGHWKPIIDNDVLEFSILMESEHKTASLLPVIWVRFIGLVAVLLAFKEVNSSFISEHT